MKGVALHISDGGHVIAVDLPYKELIGDIHRLYVSQHRK